MTIQPPGSGNILLFQSLRGNLRYYRTRAGYSQRQVAEYLGLSRPAYTYYETGKAPPAPRTWPGWPASTPSGWRTSSPRRQAVTPPDRRKKRGGRPQ